MKKLYLTILMAAMAAGAANAQLYLVGNFQGAAWDPSTPMEVNADADGNYKVTIEDLSKFKMSTVKSAVATDWDTFNGGAKGYSGEINEPGVFALENWGEDQTLPWQGDWTIEVNSSMTLMTLSTTTPKPEQEIFYLRGDMNSWGTDAAYQFQLVEGTRYVIENCEIPAGNTFKVGDAGWGKINYGGAVGMNPEQEYTLDYNSGTNCSMSSSFSGKVYFDLTTHIISFEKAAEPPVDKTLYITGFEYPAIEDNLKFAQNGNVYTLTMPEGVHGEWCVWNGTWKYCFGGNVTTLGESQIWFGSTIYFTYNTTNPLTITITVPEGSDVIGATVPATILLEEANGVDEIASDNAEAEYFNLQGVRVGNPENGIYLVRRGNKVSKEFIR